MGRTQLKVKPFINESLQKGYINLKRIGKNIELYTPRYNINLDPAYEEIFKEYERRSNRKYYSYVKSRGPLISALRRSKYFKEISFENHKYIFQEQSMQEIESKGKKKKKVKVLDESPSSGYETAECSPAVLSAMPSTPTMPSVPSPAQCTPAQPASNVIPPECHIPLEEKIIDVDSLEINMEEIERIKFSDETFTKLKEDILPEGISVNELNEYLCNADQSSDDIKGFPTSLGTVDESQHLWCGNMFENVVQVSQGRVDEDQNVYYIVQSPGNFGQVSLGKVDGDHNVCVDQLSENDGQVSLGRVDGNQNVCYSDQNGGQVSAGRVDGNQNLYVVDQLCENVGQVSQGVVHGNQPSEIVGQESPGSSAEQMQKFTMHKYCVPGGKIVLVLVPEEN